MNSKLIKSIIASSLLLLTNQPSNAQFNWPATNQWSTYLPYGTTIGLVSDGNTKFCISRSTFFTYDETTGEIESYSKVKGMSDVDMTSIGYDASTKTVVLGYLNGNIDLYKDGKFINIPDVMNANVGGEKSANHIFCKNGLAYLSTNQGLIIVNIAKAEIKETIPFYQGINLSVNYQTTADNENLYVATSTGVYKTLLSNPLMINYSTWTLLNSAPKTQIAIANNQLYVGYEQNVYHYQNNSFQIIKQLPTTIQSFKTNDVGELWVSPKFNSQNYVLKLAPTGTVVDSLGGRFLYDILDEGGAYIWGTDDYSGLLRLTKNSGQWDAYSPSSVSNNGAYDVWANDGEFYVAHGAYKLNSWQVTGNKNYFTKVKNGIFDSYIWKINELPINQDYIADCIAITKNVKTNEVYAGFYNGGIIKVGADNQLTSYKAPMLAYNNEGDTPSYRVTDLVLDANDNLWITQSTVDSVLRLKSFDNQWFAFRIPGVTHASNLMIDDYGQKWFVNGKSGGGVVVYNDNNTPKLSNDDRYRILTTSDNLPSNTALCIAKNTDGSVWVGTKNGIVIFNCPNEVINGNCPGYLKPLDIPEYNFAGNMFEGIEVWSIAVDAGNRKWIGTSIGLFLMSADGEQILNLFTTENSPLLSNQIISLNIDPVKGTLFISTDKGLCAYGATATAEKSTFESNIFVYPNPVPSGFNGTIAFKGLKNATDIRITDIKGQLVYKTTTNGGMATWNGYDYTGRRAQTGVYLVFAVSKDGTEKMTGKFIFNE